MVENIVVMLTSPIGMIALLTFGFLFLYFELQHSGVGGFGLVGIACLALFFWGAWINETAGTFEFGLLLVGVVALLVELVLIPGFGMVGVFGFFCILAAIVFANQDFIIPQTPEQWTTCRQSLLILAISCLGMTLLTSGLIRVLARRIESVPPTLTAEEESLVNYTHLFGQKGVTTTPLSPSGKALFGEELIDVLSEGTIIEARTAVVATAVHGNYLVVKEKNF